MKPVSQAGSNFSTVLLDASSASPACLFEPPSCLMIIQPFFFFVALILIFVIFIFIFVLHHRIRLYLRHHHQFPSLALTSFPPYAFSFHPFVQVFVKLLYRGEETNHETPGSSLSYFFHPPFPAFFQPTAIMEALKGGSSSASTSRSTKRNGMKRNETRTETAFTPNDSRDSSLLLLYFLSFPCLFRRIF